MTDLAIYAGLFLTALAAATILPMQSEAVLAGLLVLDRQPVGLLITIASVGNVLGSAINWAMGRGVQRFSDKRWFPVSAKALDRATLWYQRYGKWSLLFCWVPIVGDPLTVVAGVLKEPFGTFLILVTIAKVSRYVVLAMITLNWA